MLVALRRLSEFLTAEELEDSLHIDYEAKNGVEAEGAFTWETIRMVITDVPFQIRHRLASLISLNDFKVSNKLPQNRKHWWSHLKRRKAVEELPLLPIRMSEDNFPGHMNEANSQGDDKPFELTDIAIRVPSGSFVAIVGRVGSGKVLLLAATSICGLLNFPRVHFFKH